MARARYILHSVESVYHPSWQPAPVALIGEVGCVDGKVGGGMGECVCVGVRWRRREESVCV